MSWIVEVHLGRGVLARQGRRYARIAGLKSDAYLVRMFRAGARLTHLWDAGTRRRRRKAAGEMPRMIGDNQARRAHSATVGESSALIERLRAGPLYHLHG